ncbi:hypothetical protein BST33_05790 [Mycolicibacter minnesotensis]|uniref:Uncharacterized protein n=1 Tax=Mycolicibacter minnesotensis TaxID=1118379 RepID=A0AA91M7X6_9MYCO|nr:hypothetical protein BST33_05790 [Mycolicibacter minnesotensis]
MQRLWPRLLPTCATALLLQCRRQRSPCTWPGRSLGPAARTERSTPTETVRCTEGRVHAVLTILASFFTAGRRRGWLVPAAGWALLAVDLLALAIAFRPE